ncbi:MAG TPA: lipid II flippase MurJ [Rugosibacter sp.]
MMRDTMVVVVASLVVATAVIFREQIIASRFGVGDITDAFALASSVVIFLAAAIGGSLASSLIPVSIQIEVDSGKAAAEAVCRAVLARILVGMVAVSVLLYAFSEPIISVIAHNFAPEKRQLTQSLFMMTLPLLPLAGWAAYATVLLNIRRRLLFSTLASAMIPLTGIIIIQISPVPGALALGLVLGYLMQCLFVAFILKEEPRWLWPKWQAQRSHLRAVWHQYLPVTIGSLFMTGTVVTDQVMAGWLTSGSVATLAFASILVNYLNAFAGRALGVPAIIHFSTLTAHKKWAEARRLMGQALLIIGGIALGLTIIVWGFSDWLVAQLFERGAFTAIDTAHVAEVQKYYSLQLTFQFVGVLLVRMLSALGKNRVILAVAMFNFLANILLNWIFMKTLGVAGIALATSVVLFISSLFCGAVVWRSLNVEFPGKRSV